jgi:hypothetical protein
MGMEKYTPNRARFFLRKKYTTFSTERIVALRSVNKIFPESYDFAASILVAFPPMYKLNYVSTYRFHLLKKKSITNKL